MPGVIVLSDIESATNTDILQGTRLQTVPQGGFLTFELQSSANDASNSMAVSIQMPNGCLLYTSPSPRDRTRSRMPSSA